MSLFGFEILLNISIVSAFLPFAMLLSIKNSTFLNFKRVLLYLTSYWIITEAINFALAHSGRNTCLNVHIYDLISTLLYLMYFKHIFKSDSISKKLDIVGFAYVVVTSSMIIINDAYFETVLTNLALTMTIPFVLALLSFYKLAKEAKVDHLLSNPIYWINSAILMHFGMSITGVLISDIVYDNLNLHLYIWPVVIISNILYNILFTVGAWKMRQT